uniref:F-box domain-containing protein n=1 Tax=Syphacia muris TaxID=451379 RepID=A0A0N5AWB9_9BILA
MSETNEIDRLPVEILLKILSNLDNDDIQRCKFICNRWNRIIMNNRIYLARMPVKSRIFISNDGELLIQLQKFAENTVYTSEIARFDTQLFRQLELRSLEISSIDDTIDDKTYDTLFNCLLESIQKYRQRQNVRTVKLVSIRITERTQSYFLSLLQSLAYTDFRIENCRFTKEVFAYILKQLSAVVTHVEWISCSTDTDPNCADQLITHLANVTKLELCQRHNNSFVVKADHISPEVVCTFLEAWINARNAPFFTFFIQQCSDNWKLIFLNECDRRKLPQCYYEFASRKNKLSHVKVRFINRSNSCEMCPIFDVPARSAGQLICYSRYFRDF